MKAQITVAAIFASCWSGHTLFAGGPETIEIYTLSQNPQIYSGKILRTVGILELNFEGDTVCGNTDKTWTDCVVLVHAETHDNFVRKHRSLDGSVVEVEGLFNAATPYKPPHKNDRGELVIEIGGYGHMNTLRNFTMRSVSQHER